MVCIGLGISMIVGLLWVFCLLIYLVRFWCSCLVSLGFSVVLLFCVDFCKICFNCGLSVNIGSFVDILVIFCMMKWFSVVCIVVVSMVGFWLLGVCLISVLVILCSWWIGMCLISRFCSMCIIVDSGSVFGVRFLMSLGVFLVRLVSRCCIFLWLSSLGVCLWIRCDRWVVIMVVGLIIV